MKLSSISLLFWFLHHFYQLGILVQASDVLYYDFMLKEKNFTRMCTTKSMLVVNESFPGPVIYANRGDTVFVNVHNLGNYDLTLHWHGVKQPRNPWYDGPEYITQCGIAAGTNFTYEIIFSDEEGTLWWHAHSRWSRESLHGAIVIAPAVGTTLPFPEPDGDQVIILASWFDGDLLDLVGEGLANGSNLPDPDAYLMNGLTGDFDPCSQNSSYNLKVEYGKTYLIRIINAVMNEEMFFAIADHNLTVVGIDGSYTTPFTTNYVLISTGQTLNVLLTADQPLGKYYIAARSYSIDTSVLDMDVTGILQYNYDNSSSHPIFPTTLPKNRDMASGIAFSKQLKSLDTKEHPVNVPVNITTKMYITLSMNTAECSSCSDVKLSSSMNNVSWLNPTTDVLSAYYSNISGIYTNDFPEWPEKFFNFTGDDMHEDITKEGTKVKVLNYGEGVEMVFQGTTIMDGTVNHPMHLHGYSFYVVGYGKGNFDNETDPDGYNLVNPPEVNTFGAPQLGWIAIRFFANNPGVWFWHCHYEKHLNWGMATVFIVQNGDTAETSMRDRPAYMPSCTNNNNNNNNLATKMEETHQSTKGYNI